MKSPWLALLLTLFAALAACQTEDEPLETPVVAFSAVSRQATAVSLDLLAQHPATYDGSYLQVTGQYRRLPRLICNTDPHPSPATWIITNNNLEVNAAGFDSQLRSLIADGLTVTVAGRWKQWQGLVGCGSSAQETTVWYLQVDDIVSPSTLAQVTLTPVGGAAAAEPTEPLPLTTVVVDMVTPAEPLPPTPEEAYPGLPTSTPFNAPATPDSQSSPNPTIPPLSSPTMTPTGATSTATATVSGNGSASSTPTATVQGAGTPTATSPSAPTRTPTATQIPVVNTVAPTATQAPVLNVVDKGSIDEEELVAADIKGNEIHQWTFTVLASEAITISLASSPAVDATIVIQDAQGNTLLERNQAGAGAIEHIKELPISAAGNYRIHVRSNNAQSGSYAMFLLYSGSYPFTAAGSLAYNGQPRTVSLPAATDHFWFFTGTSGDVVSISITPTDNGDLFMELYGADADNISGFIDNGGPSEQEQLASFTLPKSGMYSIRVGEYDFQATNYQIVLTRN